MTYDPGVYDPGIDVVAIVAKIDTGHNSAGNGGDGYNTGNLTNDPSSTFDTYNKAHGSDVDTTTGDSVHQKAYWDAGGANGGTATATASDPSYSYDPSHALAKANGGYAESNGDQYSSSGGNTSHTYANTDAYQENWAAIDQHANQLAGNGGHGGDGNTAVGGDSIINLDHFSV